MPYDAKMILLKSGVVSSADLTNRSPTMMKSALIAAIRQEIYRHDLSHFMDEENKRVVPGCPKCRKRFFTVPQFMDHLSDDVLPPLLDRLSSGDAKG